MLMIKDLSAKKELDAKEMSAVRGGSIVTTQGGQTQTFAPVQANGGTSIGSPQTNTNVGVNAPSAVSNDVSLAFLNNLLGTMNANIVKA
jgi:hypothetical protein